MEKYFKRAAVTLLWLVLVPAVYLICGIISLSLYVAMRLGLKNRTAFDIMASVSSVEFVSLPYCVMHGENVHF